MRTYACCGFGIATAHATWGREAAGLFRAGCTRSQYTSKSETFVVSPSNARRVLDAFLKKAKTQLLISGQGRMRWE